MQTEKKKKGQWERCNTHQLNVVRKITCHFFLLHVSEASFLKDLQIPGFFRIVTPAMSVAYCNSLLSISIPLCSPFTGFCYRMFCCQKLRVRVVKLKPFSDIGRT